MNTSSSSTGLQGLIATAIFGALALSFAVSAAKASSVSLTVKFADLHISKPTGAAVLYARINAAAKNACSYYWFKSDADENRCVHDAILNTVNKINQPALFAVYNGKNKTSLPTNLLSKSR
jgi:UrcA family protein